MIYYWKAILFDVESHPRYPSFRQCRTSSQAEDARLYSIFSVSMMYFAPLLVVIFTYTAILLKLIWKSRESKQQTQCLPDHSTISPQRSFRNKRLGVNNENGERRWKSTRGKGRGGNALELPVEVGAMSPLPSSGRARFEEGEGPSPLANSESLKSSGNGKTQLILRMSHNATTNITRAKSRTLRLTIVIVLVFVLCWTPYVVMTLWMANRKSRVPMLHPDSRKSGEQEPALIPSQMLESEPSTVGVPSTGFTGDVPSSTGFDEESERVAQKLHDEANLKKLEMEVAKKKAQKLEDHLARIDYNKFPTILGWYFDGSFTANFNLNEEYVEYFSEIEEEIEAKRDYEIEESFTEKAFRNFWPPKFFGHFFRTRGVYLDLKETREDPPKTPPEINFERHGAVIGIGQNDEPGDEDGKIRFGNVEYASASGRRANDKRDDYFWDDDIREFSHKEEDEEYEWSEESKVWRKSSPHDRNPYSWYWHPREGKFLIRDKSKNEDYVFDQHDNIYRRKGMEKIHSKNGLTHHDYFYCEISRKWIRRNEAKEGEVESYTNGKRDIRKGPRGTTGLGPDDFYYSSESGKMTKKDENLLHQFYYDTKDMMFKKHGEAYGPGKSGMYPHDYKFSSTDGEWLPKNPLELYRPTPYDWYFDDDKGRFYPLDKTQRDDYEFDQFRNIWKMKGRSGPSENELSPDDYVYDETTRTWKLEDTLQPEQIVKYLPGKRKLVKGLRGKSGRIPDDYFYDSLLGEFLLKELGKLGSYCYDINDEAFRKKGQPYGPGKSLLLPSHYYFDEIEGKWTPTSEAKTILGRHKEIPTLSADQFNTPYDFAFDLYHGTFSRRNPNDPANYEYNPDDAVYTLRGIPGPSVNGKKVRDYYFDETTYGWMPLEAPKGHEARDYKNGRRNNRLGHRGKSGRIPDDFFFTEGSFREKDPSRPELYVYRPALGVWELKDPAPNPRPGALNVTDYYFSFEEGLFFPKKDLKFGELALDKNTNLWVQKLRIPHDYLWDGRAYVLKPTKIVREEVKPIIAKTVEEVKEPEKEKEWKDYDRPWLSNYPYLAADKPRFDQEIEKVRSKQSKVNPVGQQGNTKGKPPTKKDTSNSKTQPKKKGK